MFRHILIPTDGSELSNDAVAAGVTLAQRLGARVTGFFAAPAPTPLLYARFLPVGYAPPAEHARMIEETSRRYLAVVEEAARAAGVDCAVVHTTSDFPADAILEAVRRCGCDTIFMASHGRRARKGPMLGSETCKVVSQAMVPVVVYRVEAARP